MSIVETPPFAPAHAMSALRRARVSASSRDGTLPAISLNLIGQLAHCRSRESVGAAVGADGTDVCDWRGG